MKAKLIPGLRAVLLLFALVLQLPRPAFALPNSTKVRGQVVNATDGGPVENAQVSLALGPTGSPPAFKVATDLFGFFTLTNVAAGQYKLAVDTRQFLPYSTNLTVNAGISTNKLVKLTPIDGKVVFDLFFQVWCRATEAPLVGSNIQIEYWQPGSDLSFGPDNTSNLQADADGAATASGLEDGFYRFTISRPGWETLVYQPQDNGDFVVVGDKVRLIRSAIASAFLQPIRTNLKVTVNGYDPVQDKPNQPLKGMIVKLTGVSLSDPTVTIVPAFSALSQEDGSITFNNLPPIQWQVQVGHLGYVTSQTLVSPDATGSFAPVNVAIALEPTKVNVVLSSLYQTNSAVAGAEVNLEGILNSNTEGIQRKLPAVADPNDTTAVALFENLLPGRYHVRVQHQVTLSGLPNMSGPLPGPDSFHIDYFPQESFAEVASSDTEELDLELNPIPARIQGRLSAEDAQARVEEDPFEPHQNRVWHRIAQNGVMFIEHKVIKLLDSSSNSFSVDTDSSGHYTILIPPGIFGIQIPSMTDYSGHNIEVGDLTAKTPPTEGPWPYPDVWPYQTFEDQHHGAGLRFDSSHEYQVDLFLHRHFLNLVGQVQATGEPFSSLVLSMKPDGTSVQSISYNHLADVKAEVVATGPTTVRTKVYDGGYWNLYVLKNLQPGAYSITLNSAEYTTQPVKVTIAPWQAPGVLPAIPPQSPGYYFPGINQYDQAFTLNPKWAAQGTLSINHHVWEIPKDSPPYYLLDETQAPSYFRMSGLPGRLFTFNSFTGGIPTPSYTIWQYYPSWGWFTSAGSGSQIFDAYEGGDLNNEDPSKAPSDVSSYTMDLHAYSISDPHLEIPNVTVKFQHSTRLAGRQVTQDDSPYPTGASQVPGQWNYDSSQVVVEDASIGLIRVTVLMKRAMVVSGTITSIHGPVPNAAIVVRNRYGNPVGKTVTADDGTFSVGNLPPQTIYLDVNRRGFIAQRQQFTPLSPDAPDISATISMQEVPAPTIDKFTMNRFGMFLPGVLKSGDVNGLTPDDARDALTVTWKGEAHGTGYSYTLAGTVQADETQGPDETFQVVDPVTEVWIVDRRAFQSTFVNDPNQNNFSAVDPPSPLTYINVMNWLADVNAGQKGGTPYYVIHQLVHRGEAGPGNKFQGQFRLWELPSGVFNPRLVAVTENGGVAVMDYQLPTGAAGPSSPNYINLQGMNMPTWLAGLTEVIAQGASAGKFTEDIHATYGEGFMKIGTGSPVAEAHITLDPQSSNPDDDANIIYKYVLGVELPLGEGGSDTGPITFGPSLLGYKVTGLTVEFEVSGRDRKAGLALVTGGGKAPDFEKRTKDYKPSVTKPLPTGTVHFEPPEFKQSAKIGATQILDADWEGHNILSGYSFVLEGQGTVDIKADADLDFVVHRLPYAGPVLATLKKVGIRVGLDALFESTIGAKLSYEHITSYPRVAPGTQSAPVQGQRWDFMGSATNVNQLQLNIILRVAVGLRLTARAASDTGGVGPKVEGSGLVQLGAPKGSNNPEGMYFQIDPINRSPLIQKVSGSFSLLARVGVSLWTIQYSKQWQLDLARWDHDFTVQTPAQPPPGQTQRGLRAADSDGPLMQLTPLYITYTVFNPATAPPYSFAGTHGTLVRNFYRPGAMTVSHGNAPLLAFTAVDPSSGQSSLMVSTQGKDQWNLPTKVATAGGLVSVSVVENPAGGWMAIWSEIASADLGNPYPSTTLKYSVSGPDGTTWSAPATILESDEAVFGLKGVTVGKEVVLTFLSTAEGPLGDNQSLYSSMWDGKTWAAPVQLLPPQTIRTTDLAGNASGLALLAVTTGDDQLLTFDWNGFQWSAAQPMSASAAGPVAVAFGNADSGAITWQDNEGTMSLRSRPLNSATWSGAAIVLTNTPTPEVQLVPLNGTGENLYLLAWIGPGQVNSLFYAIVDAFGQYRVPPTEATVGSAGAYLKLHARALPDGLRADLVAQYNTSTNSSLTDVVVGLPSSGDCNGNGIPDDIEIASGLAADCNHNGIPDTCEIASGAAQDRNHNGIPDECEPAPDDDCNRNGISDAYELSLGIGDFNGNGILDECETALQTRTVPRFQNGNQLFYRASQLHVKGEGVDSMELEYVGILEQAQNVDGPWFVVLADANTQTQTVPLTHAGKNHFYRATNLQITAQGPDSLALSYTGTLEEADSLAGPWTVVASSGLTVTRTVPLSPAGRARFYRATNLRVKSQATDSLGLEYIGTLEQATDLKGPWSTVP